MKESETFRGKKIERGSYISLEEAAEDIVLKLASAPIYKKYGRVQARQALPGEKIETILPSGITETVNTALEKDWVVTNPSGERYIVSEEKFLRRYKPSQEKGTYDAIGYCRAISNYFNQPVKIMASWGELQTGDENCMIAIVCDENGDMDGEPYIIDGTEFNKTYKLKQ